LINEEIPKGPHMEELKHWCKEFHKYGFVPLNKDGISSGNLSFRIEEGKPEYIITSSTIGPKDSLTDDCFTKVIKYDKDNESIYAQGVRQPSSESRMHYEIYKNRSDVDVIFHGHSKLILDNSSRIKIPETEKFQTAGTPALIEELLKVLKQNNFIILKDHGFLSLGKDMKSAGEAAIEIYKKCS